MNDEAVAFTNFCLDARLGYTHNTALVYYLIHAQSCSIRAAARAIGLPHHRLILHELLPANPCFDTQLVTGLSHREGGYQRKITLSETARAYLDDLKALAEARLGKDRCMVLRKMAETTRAGKSDPIKARKAAQFAEWLGEKKELIKRNPKLVVEAIAENAPKYGGTMKEAMEVLRNARG